MITFKIKLGVGVRRDDPVGSSHIARGVALDLGDRLHLELRLREPWDPRWVKTGRERDGLYTGTTLCVGPLALVFDRRHLTYGEAVGAPPYLRDPALDWVIDEFDSSFNALAVASLKYHCDWAITDIGDERRAEFQQLIERLEEPGPTSTAKSDVFVFEAHGEPFSDVGETVVTRRLTPEERAAHEEWRAREAAWQQRIDEARRDFVGVMRELWS